MNSPRFASAFSDRHDGTLAIREAVEQLVGGLDGRRPDLLVAFVTQDHRNEFEELGARLGELTGSEVVIGCGGESVIGRVNEVERAPALSLWAAASEDLEVSPFRVSAHPTEDEGIEYSGHPGFSDADERTCGVLLLGDPFSFPTTDYLDVIAQEAPSLPVVGGMASGGTKPGESALFLGGERYNSGAVGVRLSGGIEMTNVLSQAYRPVGEPWVITSCDGTVIRKLGGKPAPKAMMQTLEGLPESDRHLLQNAPVLGVAWDATKSEFCQADFLAHPIRGIATQIDSLVIQGQVRAGQTVQFMILDPKMAGEDLSQRLSQGVPSPPAAPHDSGALLFTCNGRGSRMFAEPNHDISRLQASQGDVPIPAAGFFAMGEIGRAGGRNHLHGFTASAVIFSAASSNDGA